MTHVDPAELSCLGLREIAELLFFSLVACCTKCLDKSQMDKAAESPDDGQRED